MFQIQKKLNYKSLGNPKLLSWLDKKFRSDLVLKDSTKEEDKQYSMIVLEEFLEWGQDFKLNFPSSPEEALFYIAREHFPRGNLQGRASMEFIWPKFFETFPLGEIWLIDLSYKEWFYPMWENGNKLSKARGIDFQRDGKFQPLEETGFSGELLPFTALSFMQTCFYPFLTGLFSHTSSDLIFLYIPDRSFDYSVLKENITFSKMFYSIGLDSIYTDANANYNYTSKYEADRSKVNPIRLKNFYVWYIKNIGSIMEYILRINDPDDREKLAMTLNRALWDAQIAISNDIPYISKTHFFGLIDKIANIQAHLKNSTKDSKEWVKLTNPIFIKDTLGNIYDSSNDVASEYLNGITKNIYTFLQGKSYSGNDLLNIRNSLHGYNICKWDELSRKTGELSNNITLLSLPYILYLISELPSEKP